MTDFDQKAGQLQAMTRDTESSKEDDYSPEQVRRAVVYTREDVVLIVSYLSSVNEQLMWVRRSLAVLVVLLIAMLMFKWIG